MRKATSSFFINAPGLVFAEACCFFFINLRRGRIRTMRPVSNKIARLFLTTIGFVLLTALPSQLSWAKNPDFSKVDDILHGQRNIGRADDLVLARPVAEAPKITRQKNLIATFGAKSWNTSWTMGYVEKFFSHWDQPDWPYPQQTRIARLYEQKNDVLVMIAAHDGPYNMAIYVEDRLHEQNSFVSLFTLNSYWLTAAVADFDIDGCDDILVMNGEQAFVATTKDVKTPGSPLVFGPWIETSSALTPLGEPTVGDFNADGLLDVAWIGADRLKGGGLSVFFATVCPGKVPGPICKEATR
jgi:hypothetical protein